MAKKKGQSSRNDRKGKRFDPLNNQKLKKDPGLPNLANIKAKMDKKLKTEQNRQRSARSFLQNKNRNFNISDLSAMAREADARGREFNDTHSTTVDSFEGSYAVEGAATGQKDNSRKAYFKEFKKVLDNADVVLEVLDARDPLGCRTKRIEQDILESGLDKKIILILNKIDLVPKDVVNDWLKYLRNEYPTIAFKASTQNQRSNLGQLNVSSDVVSESMLNSSECIGADNLIKLLKNYCRNADIKTSITVGVIGFPNVGKSSVINSLKRSKVCNVGSTPGVTKNAQQIHLDKNIKLLDCPGIVFTQAKKDGSNAAEVLLRNCVKVELLDDPVTPVEVIVSRCQTEQLMELYGVPRFESSHDFLLKLAASKGKLKRGGIPDIESTARLVIQDWNNGKIPYYTIPPVRQDIHVSSSIVQGFSKEFVIPGLNVGNEGDDNMMDDVENNNKVSVIMPDTVNKDSMDEDSNMTAPEGVPEIRINIKKKGPTLQINEKPKITEESLINPQTNQDMKRQLKKKKREERKFEKFHGISSSVLNETDLDGDITLEDNDDIVEDNEDVNLAELGSWGMNIGTLPGGL